MRASTLRSDGTILINSSTAEWTDSRMLWWKKAALAEEANHSEQATTLRGNFYPGDHPQAGQSYPDDVKSNLDQAFALYRELQAAHVVLGWLESKHAASTDAAEKALILWAHGVWPGHLRNYTIQLCAYVDATGAQTLSGELSATDPNWIILSGCKCFGTEWFPKHDSWRTDPARGGTTVDGGGIPDPPAGGCK